ncbi:MAG: hybrid sensor histidine kinase/response regulator [Notoacmeibacter sp.]|nr:hybrid sensor histidine kinase/response regulator [Notoacmeibacter sp.]
MSGWLIIIVALAYVTLLFAIASIGDRRGKARAGEQPRPMIYSLSLAVYCTSWTFFGSVGLATERGIEFLAIYVGPALMFMFGHRLIRRIIRLSKAEKITSIADFLAARYGKDFTVASVATIIATVGTVPYIALQLKAISGSIELMVTHVNPHTSSAPAIFGDIALIVAVLLAVFAVLFGTRHTDATEHQDGLVLAVAVESAVKLATFLFLGMAITFLTFDNPLILFDAISANERVQSAMQYTTAPTTWLVLTVLSGLAILMLPRQFYVGIVENRSESEVAKASWMLPLYLALINLFVLPIAFAGLTVVGDQTSTDLYVVAIPLLQGNTTLALIALIGGLSAATAMVIVASVALSIMISNDLVMPIILRRLLLQHATEREDWSKIILRIRRAAIFLVLIAAFLYYREIANNIRLASIGLLSFAAIAQFAPAFLGGLIWRAGNARGAVLGMVAGFVVWAYTLLLPSVAPSDTAFIANGLFGIKSLMPQALFGFDAEPLNHGVLWSLAVNTFFYVFGSLSRVANPRERIQASIFVPRDTAPIPSLRRFRTTVTINALKDTISRYLGTERTERSFQTFEETEGKRYNGSDIADAKAIRFFEQLLASAVGSSSARLILSLLFQRVDPSSRDAYRLLDDASDALQQNRDLLQIALDQMEEGITVFDRDFGLTCWNRQFRELFDLPDHLGQVGIPLSKIIDHLVDLGEIVPEEEQRILDRMASYHRTWQLELKRSGRIIEMRSNPMPDGGVVATYADITARVQADLALKRANENLEQRVSERTAELVRVNGELAQAQQLAEEANLGKTRFLAGAGHDILQPLNAARLYCSALLEKSRQGDVRQAATNIDSSLDSVETILSAVLDISRLDTGALKPNATVFNLGELLKQIGTDFQLLAQGKHLDLRIVPSSVHVETDRNLFRRLVQNLVSNAIKYTRGGTVLVGIRRRGDLCELQIIDTGIGIPESKLNAVFGEFTRLDEGAREADGLGLGLSIVDRIARVLRLEIRMQSEPGKGTQFSVILPQSSQPATRISSAEALNMRPAVALAGLNVLCIDNDSRILDGMRLLLESWQCRVHTIGKSGEIHTSGALNTSRPDIILADYHLDGENGFDAIEALRSHYKSDIPSILLTADRSAEVKGKAEYLQIPIINKPVKPAALRAVLTRHRKVLSAAE